MQIGISIEEPAAGARASVFPESLACCFEDSRIVSETEVVVGANHHATLAFDHHFCRVRLLDWKEIRIKPESFYFLGPVIRVSLGQHVSVLLHATIGLTFGRDGGIGKTDSALRSRIHEASASPEGLTSRPVCRRYVTGLII